MNTIIDINSIESYRKFLRIKRLPTYRFDGREAWYPDEYANIIDGIETTKPATFGDLPPWMYDYQAGITRIALTKRKYAVFAECGLGKTAIMLEFVRQVQAELGTRKGGLIISPHMVIPQTIAECRAFYGDALPIERVTSAELPGWLLSCGGKVGITNYEALNNEDLRRGELGCLAIDESSMLKSHYGKWGNAIIELGRGLDWKLCLTGTPAPNDRIEYANHAVFLDHEPNVNSFLARFFINRGQTAERWTLKAHAVEPFYRALSHWAIFLTNPATYGWKDNISTVPPINVTIHDVELTDDQNAAIRDLTGQLFATSIGGIGERSKLGQIGKGSYAGEAIETRKPAFIRELTESFGNESTLIWCIYNDEQDTLRRVLPDALSIDGETPYESRLSMIDEFKSGKNRVLISKPKILGFGLNLQVATRQIFSGLQDSYESYWQAVKRSNRIGSTHPLNVHIPITSIEAPMVENVLRKAKDVERDTIEQERIFRTHAAWNVA